MQYSVDCLNWYLKKLVIIQYNANSNQTMLLKIKKYRF